MMKDGNILVSWRVLSMNELDFTSYNNTELLCQKTKHPLIMEVV